MDCTSDTFSTLVGRIVEDFEHKSSTIGSLQLILEQIDGLPREETAKYDSHIAIIRKTIKEYGKEDKRLTDRQANKLVNILRKSIKSTSLLSDAGSSLPLKSFTARTSSNNRFQLYDQPMFSTSSRTVRWSENYIKKFESNDVIFAVVFNLLINLSQNVMSSTYNTSVIEYFEILSPILEEDPDRYLDLTSDIQKCLQKHGWDCTGNATVGGRGFTSDFDHPVLVDNLQKIIDKYF